MLEIIVLGSGVAVTVLGKGISDYLNLHCRIGND